MPSNTVTPILGVAFDERNTDNARGIELGTLVNGEDGYQYIFVIASGAIAAAATCAVDIPGGTFVATSGAGDFTADVAFADAEYGWVKRTAFS